MINLFFLVEGQTEEEFINKILSKFLLHKQIYCRSISFDGTPSFAELAKEVKLLFKKWKSQKIYITTMLDLYRLKGDYPEYQNSLSISDPYIKISHLEQSLTNSIENSNPNIKGYFISYLQLHEFESMLFVNPDTFNKLDPQISSSIITKLWDIVKEFENVELINKDNPPSKRIELLIKQYNKIVYGNAILEFIGINKIREKCKHFNEWLNKLESLV